MYKRLPRMFFSLSVSIIIGILLCVSTYWLLISPPRAFPAPYHLVIEPGQTLFSISHELVQDQVIRSPRVFEMLMLTFGSEKRISDGEYYFAAPTSVIEIALRISGKQFGIDRQKVTFPEGFSNADMARRLKQLFPEFNDTLFLQLGAQYQGYLFPDTYGFFPSTEPDVVIAALKRTFAEKIGPYNEAIAASGHSKAEIITMASIIEKEAAGADRAMVAGILWKRIAHGMPLQVDAPFLYLLGKESKDLTREDLAMRSPYNTYINKGLPPMPINNPGLAAIDAALHPTPSAYLYYLHDSTGGIHYASTYAVHKKNITTYLK